jgi:Flp pilus assembly secretin CpaC
MEAMTMKIACQKANDRSPYAAAMMGIMLLLPMSANAEAAKATEPQQMNLVVGKSNVVDLPMAIKRASLADPQVADAIVLSPKQIYVTGKGYGTTNLTLWGKDDQVIAVFDLDVGVDLVRLKNHLAELLPEETNVHLKGTHDHVTISGTVSSEGRLHQILAVAEAYAPKKVLNFLKIYPEPIGDPAPDIRTVTVEVIKGTSVGSVKF